MEEKLVIQGGYRLSGHVLPGGNKNEALPCIAAALLTDGPVTLHNVPRIRDVEGLLDILRDLGAVVTNLGPNSVCIEARDVHTHTLDPDVARRLRASILLAGPMVARTGSVDLPPPGGDVIGRRRLDTHFVGLQHLGASVEVGTRTYHIEAKRGLDGADIFLDEASVTATENIVMAAALARGVTRVHNAACEPHVEGLCAMLTGMGAVIQGAGTNSLTITGVPKLNGVEYRIGTDYLEVGSFIGLAAVTGSEISIADVDPHAMRKIRMVFERLGVRTELSKENVLFVPGDQEMVVRPDLHGVIPKIDDAPWPQFPTDLMSIAIVTATQCRGTVLFFEKMYEGRMFFVDSLIAMGAQIILCDPHRVVVVGPSQLYGSRLESPDVRAGMAVLIASLCARGESTIYNIRQIDRGYERIDEKLRQLGARIDRVRL